jgi:hypothetical protein
VIYTRRSFTALTTAATLLLCAILASTPASALPLLESLPTLDSLKNRLELTPEQESKLAPMFDKRIAELRHSKELLEQATSGQQRSDVMREAKQAGDAFNTEVERLLTPSQQHEWREIVSELREQAKERIEEKLESR